MDEKDNTSELIVVDVKRYKRVKKALAESEERYRQLFENVPIGIYRTTPDGRIIDANPALVSMLGYGSFAELASRNLEKDPRHAEYPRSDFIKRLERDGEIKGLEATWNRKDGSLIHVQENAKLVPGENGQVFFEGTVEDVTQRKQAEAAQRVRTQQVEILNCIISKGNTAESLQEMLEVILDCLVVPLAFDTAGVFMYDHESKAMRLLARRGPPTDFARNEKYMSIDNMPFSQVLQHGQPVFLDDTRTSHPYFFKEWGWRMAGSVPLVSKGRVVGALNVASSQRAAFTPEEKDILEMIGKESGTLVSKLQTEVALRESEKYYRALIDTSPDIIVVMDLDANLITVNQQFLKVGGYFYDDVIGKCTYDFVSGLERLFLEKKPAQFIENKHVSGSEYQFKNKDGQAIPLEVSASVLLDSEGRPAGIIAIGRDITERKRAELNLEEKNRVLATLNEISLELAMMPPAADINEYISEKLMSITKAIYVGVNHFNKDTRQLEFVSARTASKILNEVSGILGKPVGAIRYDVSEAMYKEITGEIVGYRGTLHEASFGTISEKASSIIQRMFNIDHFIGMALVVENELIGTAIMAVAKGTPAVSLELLKSISHIVSVSLRRRSAEFQLAASEEKFKKLFYISPDSFILSHLDDLKIVSVNKGFTKILGYKESEVVGKTIAEIKITKNPGENEKIIDALRTGGAAENIEQWFVNKSGKSILGLVSAAIIDINGEKFLMNTMRDISERNRVAEALRESEEKFRSIAEQTSDLIAITDDAGIITYASSSAKALFQYEGGEMVGHNFMEFLDAPSIPRAMVAFRDDLEQGGKSVGLELTMKRKDGSTFAGELNGSSFQYGNQFGSMVVIRDIEQRKRSEEQIRFLGSITENTSDAIIVTDLKFVITYMNLVAEKLFGYTLEEVWGQTPGILNVDPNAAEIQDKLYKIIASGKTYLGESLNRRKDGSTFYCEYKVMPLRDDNGKIYAYSSVQRDVSERKRKEEALRQSEEMFRRTFEGIPDPAYIWTRHGDGRIRLSRFNQAAATITQDKIKALIGVEVEKLFDGQPGFVKKITLTMDKGQRQFEEVLYKYQTTGLSKWLQTDYVKTADDNVLVITKDVSERKEAEGKLLAYQEQLRALTSELGLIEERERRRIASELHDQIGQNLSLCKLKVTALEKNTADEDSKGELSTVRRLLECSIQDARSLIFDLSPPVLYELGFQAALEWLAEWIGEQFHVAVEFENRAGEEPMEIDRQVILFQIVRELLVNVGKHAQASQAKVILSQEKQSLRIQVNDDGVGFDATKIYDAKGRGGGFGFFSMRERLNYLGGSLEVKSRPGQGSQIVLSVPEGARPPAGKKEEA